VLLTERTNVEVLSAMTKTHYMVILMKYGMCTDTHLSLLTEQSGLWYLLQIAREAVAKKSVLFYA